MARALAAAVAFSLLAVSGAGGSGAQTPKRGGTIVIQRGITQPTCFMLFRDECRPTSDYVDEVLEGAFELGPDSELRPKLVSHVDVNKKPPFTLTYHIRPEARWSDGIPVSARDFVFTHRAVLRLDPTQDIVERKVRSIRTLDLRTVRVVLRSRIADWQYLFFTVLPAHALAGEDLASEALWRDRIDNPKTGRPIGSGPFLVQRLERGRRLTFVRNARYWGRHRAYLDRLVFRLDCRSATGATCDVSDAIEALRRRELDLVQGVVNPDQMDELRSVPGVRILVRPGIALEHVALRLGAGGHAALRQKAVRRALAYGIDRVALVRELWVDVLPAYRPLQSAIFREEAEFYEPHWNSYRYRPVFARRLLEQAGCERGADGIYVCGGERLSLRLVTTAGATARIRTATRIATDLRRIGVEIKPEFAPNPVFINEILFRGLFELAVFSYFYDPLFAVEQFGCGGLGNVYGYCQRLVTRELDQAQRIVDETERSRALNRADVLMAKDVPLIPLFQAPVFAAARSNIRGFTQTFPLLMWNTENWWLER